jgi:hypothetical protein
MSAEWTADDYRAALEAAGWATSFRILFHPHGRAWVASAVKGGRSVEGRGDPDREAWERVYREVFKGGGA